MKEEAATLPAAPYEEGDGSDVTAVKSLGPYVGRYRLCFEIAAGGMAMVYLARSEGPAGFEKVVALKVIHRHLARERAFVEMFLDEARIASKIHHANVCTLFDFGEADGTYFIAMEYLVGEPLMRVLKAVARSREEREWPGLPYHVAKIIADACEGLHAAHELKGASGELLEIVHRDVSPQNLFITYDGVTKVVDFGVASARDRVHHTATGQIKGKFAYMPPEQLTRQQVDRRADVWALGVVLWEMLCCRRLFRREGEVETMRAVLEEVIPPPSSLNPHVPKALDHIVLRALQRDIDQRYPTTRALGSDLVHFLAARGTAIGLAELSAWMDRLFPAAEAKKRQLVDLAQQMNEVIPRAHEESRSAIASVPNSPRSSSRRWLLGLGAALTLPTAVAGFFAGHALLADSNPVVVTTLDSSPHGSGGGADDDDAPRAPETEPAFAFPPDDDAGTVEDTVEHATDATDPADADDRGSQSEPSTPRRASRARVRRPPPATMEAAPADGTVAISTPGGWARVYADGRLLGETPLRAQLPAGSHTLEIRPFGQPPGQQRVVQVRGGAVSRVVLRLESTP